MFVEVPRLGSGVEGVALRRKANFGHFRPKSFTRSVCRFTQWCRDGQIAIVASGSSMPDTLSKTPSQTETWDSPYLPARPPESGPSLYGVEIIAWHVLTTIVMSKLVPKKRAQVISLGAFVFGMATVSVRTTSMAGTLVGPFGNW